MDPSMTVEMIERWREAGRRYVPEGVMRSFTVQASYFGSEISNFLESEMVVGLLKQDEQRIDFSEHVFLSGSGLWRFDCNMSKKEPSTAYDAAFAALCSGKKDPFQFLIDELIQMVAKS